MTRILFPFLFLLLGPALMAQQARQYSFRHLTVAHGLASNTIHDVVQDKDGYMWFATTNGLQRYDGHAFMNFRANSAMPGTIPTDHVGSLYIDGKQNLWVLATASDIGIFDTKAFTYRKVPMPKDGLPYETKMEFTQMHSGELILVKTSKEILRYDESRQVFVNADSLLHLPRNWHANRVVWDSRLRRYWVSCDSGMLQYDPFTRHVNYRNHNIDRDPVIEATSSVLNPMCVRVDKEGNVFFYTWPPTEFKPTIQRYNRRLARMERTDLWDQINVGYHELVDFLVQRNGRIWVYGMPFFAEWIPGTTRFASQANEYRHEQSLKFDHASRVYEDRENSIWIATDNGVFVFNPDEQNFNTFYLNRPGEPVMTPPVQGIAELDDGRIFLGTWGRGIFVFDKQFNPLPLPKPFHGDPGMSVWDLVVHSRSGLLWIAQQSGRLSVYDPATNRLDDLGTPPVFNTSTIRQMDEDTSGNLWFGTQGGRLIKWDYRKSGGDYRKGFELVLQTARILKVHYDYQGFIWLGTLGKGLIKMDARTGQIVRTFTEESLSGERLFANTVHDITYYNDSTLVVAAGAVNIVNTRTNKVRFITSEQGLPSNNTVSIQRDRSGIVWVGMTDGICRLNLSKDIVSYFDRRDGIVYDKFNLAGVEQLSDGRMVFMTPHNFLVFDPRRVAGAMQPPRPYITGFRLAGRALSVDSIQSARRALLKYNNTSIAINFSALSYLQQRKVHYYYMLEGLDKDWIRVDHPIEAIYNYLPPGNYVFKVKSVNPDGTTSEETATLDITVRAPVWQTWWFFSLIALLVIAILYLLDRERMIKRRSLQQMRSQIALNLHSEVNTALGDINVLSEIAKIKADKNVVQTKEYIDQISGRSRQMIEAMDDMLWSIDPQNDNMKKTVLRIKELTDGLRHTADTPIDLIVDNRVQELELDMRRRHDLFFFYKDAITFILSELACEQIFVNLNKVRGRLLIEILCECLEDTEGMGVRFRAALAARIRELPASLEIIEENRSFAVVMHMELK